MFFESENILCKWFGECLDKTSRRRNALKIKISKKKNISKQKIKLLEEKKILEEREKQSPEEEISNRKTNLQSII